MLKIEWWDEYDHVGDNNNNLDDDDDDDDGDGDDDDSTDDDDDDEGKRTKHVRGFLSFSSDGGRQLWFKWVQDIWHLKGVFENVFEWHSSQGRRVARRFRES